MIHTRKDAYVVIFILLIFIIGLILLGFSWYHVKKKVLEWREATLTPRQPPQTTSSPSTITQESLLSANLVIKPFKSTKEAISFPLRNHYLYK